MSIFKLNIRTIYLMMGDGCNLACRYCIQGKNQKRTENLPTKINPSIYNFIRSIAYDNNNSRLNLLFYGGEPLLYWNNIKDIIEKTRSLKIHYSIITNGKLITEEIIDFFNKNNVNLIISWDGNRSINTRKFDVFSDQNKKELIFKSNNFSINSVISAMNYPLEAVNDIQDLANEYYNYNSNGFFSVNFDEIIDNNLVDKTLLKMDYNRVQIETEQIINDCSNYLLNRNSINNEDYKTKLLVKYSFLSRYLWTISEYLKNPNNFIFISPCRDGLERLGLDLNGNIYSCHDSREIIGNINNLDLITYLSNYLKYDTSKELYNSLCKDCKYWPLCLGRCKLLTKEARINHTCKLKKAIGEPLLNFLNKNKK